MTSRPLGQKGHCFIVFIGNFVIFRFTFLYFFVSISRRGHDTSHDKLQHMTSLDHRHIQGG